VATDNDHCHYAGVDGGERVDVDGGERLGTYPTASNGWAP